MHPFILSTIFVLIVLAIFIYYHRIERSKILSKYPDFRIMKISSIAKLYSSGMRPDAMALMRLKFGVSLATARFIMDNYAEIRE